MKLFVMMLLMISHSVATAGQETLNTCNANQPVGCKDAYEDAGKLCNRYYLQETEAYSLCHNTAQKRYDMCMSEVETKCAEEERSDMHEDQDSAD